MARLDADVSEPSVWISVKTPLSPLQSARAPAAWLNHRRQWYQASWTSPTDATLTTCCPSLNPSTSVSVGDAEVVKAHPLPVPRLSAITCPGSARNTSSKTASLSLTMSPDVASLAT